MTRKVNIIQKATLSILTVTLIAICFAVTGGTLRTEAACYHSPATRTTGATCTASGKRQTYCRICGKVLSTSYTSALGHNYQTTKAATCTATGTKKCSRCSATKTISALGHNYNSTTKAATCTATGTKKCSRCSATTTILALGHNYQTTKAATCGATGTKKCSRCSVTQTIAATGQHTPNTENPKITPATCLSSGKKETYCKNCDLLMGTVTIAALGHNYHTTKAATCTASGTKECSRCYLKAKIPALGHNYLITKWATCGAIGIKTCSRCPATQAIPATGKHGSATRVTKAASCGATGTKQTYCPQCSKVLSTSTIAATGQHIPNTDKPKVTPATCLDSGKRETYCKNCDLIMGTVTIEALGHNHETTQEPTCGVPGIKTCTRCGDTEGISATGNHTYRRESCLEDFKCTNCSAVRYGSREYSHTLYTEKEATCTLDGQKKCVKTGCQYTDPIKAGHDKVAATCSAPERCTRCNATWGNGLGHVMTNGSCTKVAYCTREGCEYEDPTTGRCLWTPATCSAPERCRRCNATKGNGLGHIMTKGSCTEIAYCTREGCDYEDSTTGHCLWTPATCSAPERCTRCNATRGNGLGHIMTGGSCTESAYCTREGCTYKAPIEGHDYTRTYCTENLKCANCGIVASGSWEYGHTMFVDKEATCTENGLKKCIHESCSYEKDIPAGHDKIPATCSAPERCKRCNATWGNGLGHDMTVGSCTDASKCQREGCTYRDVLGSHTPQFGQWNSYMKSDSPAACKVRLVTCEDCQETIYVQKENHTFLDGKCINDKYINGKRTDKKCNFAAKTFYPSNDKNEDSAVTFTVDDNNIVTISVKVCYDESCKDYIDAIEEGIKMWEGEVDYGGTKYNIVIDIIDDVQIDKPQKDSDGIVTGCDGVLYFDMTEEMNQINNAQVNQTGDAYWGSQTGFYVEFGDKTEYCSDENMPYTVAHEIAHCFGISDAYMAINKKSDIVTVESVAGVDNNDIMFGADKGSGRTAVSELEVTNLDRCMLLESAENNCWTTFGNYDITNQYSDSNMSIFVLDSPKENPFSYEITES